MMHFIKLELNCNSLQGEGQPFADLQNSARSNGVGHVTIPVSN
jgi:hypothetical protein